MEIRKAVPEDLKDVLSLFQATIRQVNKKDYSDEQLNVWASAANDKDRWLQKIETQYFLVVLAGNEITGFGSITQEGYLDTMFVSKDHQGEGIATMILERLEAFAKDLNLPAITSDASITARPFFEKFGFKVEKRQELNKKGIQISNFKMRKVL